MPSETLPDEPGAEGRQLCLHCLAPNDPSAHFCAKCGAPLTSYASTAPFESVFAQGSVFREGAQHPKKLVVVLGMWLVFGAMIGAGILTFILKGEGSARIMGALMVVISAAILWKTTRNYLARPQSGGGNDA